MSDTEDNPRAKRRVEEAKGALINEQEQAAARARTGRSPTLVWDAILGGASVVFLVVLSFPWNQNCYPIGENGGEAAIHTVCDTANGSRGVGNLAAIFAVLLLIWSLLMVGDIGMPRLIEGLVAVGLSGAVVVFAWLRAQADLSLSFSYTPSRTPAAWVGLGISSAMVPLAIWLGVHRTVKRRSQPPAARPT